MPAIDKLQRAAELHRNYSRESDERVIFQGVGRARLPRGHSGDARWPRGFFFVRACALVLQSRVQPDLMDVGQRAISESENPLPKPPEGSSETGIATGDFTTKSPARSRQESTRQPGQERIRPWGQTQQS